MFPRKRHQWLANCYFASHWDVTLSHSVAGLAQLELVVADFKGVRLDNIFGRDRHQVERPGILFRASGPPCFQVRDDSSRIHFRSVWPSLDKHLYIV